MTLVTKKKKGRSPSYPSINLGKAIEKAKVVLDAHQMHKAPIDAVLKVWGYNSGSGVGLVTLAALKKFGLMEDEGSGKNRLAGLTDLAFRILIDDREDSEERLALIQEAALKPIYHKEMWNRYGSDLPPDSTLRYNLLTEGFTERGAFEFIQQIRATIVFAKLNEPVFTSDERPHPESAQLRAHSGGSTETLDQNTQQSALPISVPTGMRAVPIPIANSEWPVLHVPQHLTEEKWVQMLKVLEAMKPGIVTANEHPIES